MNAQPVRTGRARSPPSTARVAPGRGAQHDVVWAASIVFCGIVPALVLVTLFSTAIQDRAVAVDFLAFYAGAESVLRLESPYVPLGDPTATVWDSYVYPPVTAIGVIPFTVLPHQAAGLLAMAVLVVALLAIPFVLGVRDWRCYGLALLWPPAIQAIQTASVTIVLALAAAFAWRFRHSLLTSSTAAGLALAMKLILWPLAVWLAASRRVAAGLMTLLVGATLALGSWAAIGFSGLADYPALLRELQAAVELHSYTVYVAALDAGASPALARGAWLALGLALLTAVVLFGRAGHERQAFVLAIAAALALSPIVWLHYFTLLLVAVAIAQPTLGVAWLAPLGMFVATGSGDPTPFQTTSTILVATLTVGLALRAASTRARATPTAKVASRFREARMH